MGASTRIRIALLAAAIVAGGCGGGGDGAGDTGGPSGPGGSGPPPGGGVDFGEVHSGGQYHLGPVTFDEKQPGHIHNACAPDDGYLAALQPATGLGGEWLAGVAVQYAGGGAVCDACIEIKAGNGRSIVLRVVTYGDEDVPGSVDVSPSAYAALHTGEYPRSMTWRFTRCPDEGNLAFEFKSATNPWWFGVWVRNPRVPISKVELSTDGSHWTTMTHVSDGTLEAQVQGRFWLRVTGMDGQVITEAFASAPSGGGIVRSSQQFQ